MRGIGMRTPNVDASRMLTFGAVVRVNLLPAVDSNHELSD
jgi:hypothetical protein